MNTPNQNSIPPDINEMINKTVLKKHSALILICLGLILIFIISLSSQGMKAKIVDFLLSTNEDNLLVYFKVTDCFTKKMDEAIMAGIPTTFYFNIELSEKRPFWFNKTVSRLEIRHTIKYDTVKNIYFVKYSENNKDLEFQDYESARRAMEDLSGIKIVPLGSLKEDHTYYLNVKAKLDRIRLPLNLEHILFFVSLWDFETDNYIHSFIYKKSPPGNTDRT